MTQILIVDDDADVREAMSELLTHEGFDVSVAGDGERALKALRQAGKMPSLILLDLMMPVMNGWQFRQAQLQDPRLAEVPVIILTAAATTESNVSHLHPTAFLRKPVAVDKLLSLVVGLCR